MEDWQIDFEWLRIRHFIQDRFRKNELPDLNAILFIIGIQELGQVRAKFSKEEKQDLLHIAVCRLLSEEGYYEFDGIDASGWPHWTQVRSFPIKGAKAQAEYLKKKVINYFGHLFEEE